MVGWFYNNPKMKSLQLAILNSILAIFLLILGFIYKEPYSFIAAVILALCSFYWILKLRNRS